MILWRGVLGYGNTISVCRKSKSKSKGKGKGKGKGKRKSKIEK